MNGETKAAVYSGTRNLYPMMLPAVKSLLINSDVEKVYLLIEDGTFPYEVPDIVECIDVSGQDFFRPDGANMKNRFTYMAMMRAALFKVFPEYDTILSLDVDTFVNKDVSDIWNTPLWKDYYFAASREIARSSDGYLYTNVGVTLQNLRMFRDGKGDEIIEALNDNAYPFVDQDAFNELCQGRIFDLSSEYNTCPFTAHNDNPRIIHFAGKKKWDDEKLYKQYERASWDEIQKYRYRKNLPDIYESRNEKGTSARKL